VSVNPGSATIVSLPVDGVIGVSRVVWRGNELIHLAA
jgi:hypothetical protein